MNITFNADTATPADLDALNGHAARLSVGSLVPAQARIFRALADASARAATELRAEIARDEDEPAPTPIPAAEVIKVARGCYRIRVWTITRDAAAGPNIETQKEHGGTYSAAGDAHTICHFLHGNWVAAIALYEQARKNRLFAEAHRTAMSNAAAQESHA